MNVMDIQRVQRKIFLKEQIECNKKDIDGLKVRINNTKAKIKNPFKHGAYFALGSALAIEAVVMGLNGAIALANIPQLIGTFGGLAAVCAVPGAIYGLNINKKNKKFKNKLNDYNTKIDDLNNLTKKCEDELEEIEKKKLSEENEKSNNVSKGDQIDYQRIINQVRDNAGYKTPFDINEQGRSR